MARRTGGLDRAELASLAEKLAAGGRPRVLLSGPQFPSDTVGTVVRIGDPSVDGDEFVTVRARIGGVVDELGFAPTELSTARRGAAKASTKSAAPVATPAPAIAPVAPPEYAPLIPAAEARRAAPLKTVATPAPAAPPAPAAAPKRSATPVRRGPVTPPIKITVSSVGASWTVSVERGARTLIKNSAVTPGAVSAIAAFLDHPGVTEAVAAVNDTARLEAEARAQQLRAELAEIEAVLNSHRAP